MNVRPALPADLSACATIGCSAWLDSPVNEYLLPRRHSHPAAYHAYYLRSLKGTLEEERVFVVLAELAGERGEKDVVGFATWVRDGDSDATKKKWGNGGEKKPFLNRIKRMISNSSAVDYAYTLFNPAASLPRYLSYGNADVVYYAQNDTQPEECWLLNHLSVSPDHQKKGVGMELCKWGLKIAQEEGVSAFLYSTVVAKSLYEKAGFKAVGEWKWAMEGGNRTMTVMRWDPPSVDQPVANGQRVVSGDEFQMNETAY